MTRTASHSPVGRARTDAARLDWLETWGSELRRFPCPLSGSFSSWTIQHPDGTAEQPTVRMAIDAAMDAMERADVESM